MNIKNYRQFRDLEKTTITLRSNRTATLEAVEPDPYCAFARLTDVAFGLKLITWDKAGKELDYIMWIDKAGLPMAKQSRIVSLRMVEAALQRLPSVASEMEPVEKELCDYLASNGHPRTYADLLDMARHFTNIAKSL